MRRTTIASLAASLALATAVTAMTPSSADAQRRRVAGAIAGGVVLGAIIAGAAAANAREERRRANPSYYVSSPRSSCREFLNQARYHEARGNGRQYNYFMYRYERCIYG